VECGVQQVETLRAKDAVLEGGCINSTQNTGLKDGDLR
jgi:hypothetical protein